jgi:hypothetical protein
MTVTSYDEGRERRKNEAVSILKTARAVSAVCGVASVATAILLPYRLVVVVCGVVAYGCYEFGTIAKNCKDLYEMTWVGQQALKFSPPNELQSRITKNAPLANRILPAVLPDDFRDHFFP